MPGSTTIYVFGDNHTHPRDDVKERLNATIPEAAQAVVIEHAEKGDDRPDPSWVALKNPSLAVLQLCMLPLQNRRRGSSNRVTGAGQTTVAEEVAGERALSMEYTDISHRQRVNHQPWYLTVAAWVPILSGVLGLLVHLGFLVLSLILLFVVGSLSQDVYSRMREAKMADDIRSFASEYSTFVYFAGDSHIDPIRERLDGEFKIIEAPLARP